MATAKRRRPHPATEAINPPLPLPIPPNLCRISLSDVAYQGCLYRASAAARCTRAGQKTLGPKVCKQQSSDDGRASLRALPPPSPIGLRSRSPSLWMGVSVFICFLYFLIGAVAEGDKVAMSMALRKKSIYAPQPLAGEILFSCPLGFDMVEGDCVKVETMKPEVTQTLSSQSPLH